MLHWVAAVSRRTVRTRVVFLTALIAFAVVLSLGYAIGVGKADQGGNAWMTWFYLPGVALYILFNGSLIFGGGFGTTGDFVIIALGSAVCWACVCALIYWVRTRLFKSAL